MKITRTKTLLPVFLSVFVVSLMLVLPKATLAATSFQDFLGTMTLYLKGAIVLAAAFSSALGAFFYTTSGGDPKKIGKAKEYFYSAITALIALVIAQLFFS